MLFAEVKAPCRYPSGVGHLLEAQLCPRQFRLPTATTQVPCKGAGLIRPGAMGCYDELQFIYLTLVSRVTHERKMADGVSWLEMEKCPGFQEGPVFMQD